MKDNMLGNRYMIVEKIGKGGMALVYKAYDSRLTRDVAIKVLRHELVEDEDLKIRFLKEAQSAAKLSHQNIVSVFDVDEYENINYIVMEYVDGKSLKDLLNEEGVISPQLAVNITIEICEAIECAHEIGIIHRDIKPQNIMIKKDNSIKVTDFGIAKYVAATTVTKDGNLIGSVHYLAPERIQGFKPDKRSDIYSIGITLYEMLVGEVPFNGENPLSIMIKHVEEEPKRDILLNSVPKILVEIVLKTLNKSAEDRFKSIKELKDELIALQDKSILNVKPDNNDRTEFLKSDGNFQFTKTIGYVKAPGNTETYIDMDSLKNDIDKEEAKKDKVEFIKMDEINIEEDEKYDTKKTKFLETMRTINIDKGMKDINIEDEELFDQAPFIEKIVDKSEELNNKINYKSDNEFLDSSKYVKKGNNKFLYIVVGIGIFLIIGIFVLGIIVFNMYNGKNKEDEKVEFINYENQEFGISFSYPETWIENGGEDGYLVNIISIDEDSDYIDESIEIGVKQIGFNIPLDSFDKLYGQVIKVLTGEEFDGNLMEDSKIANHDAKKIVEKDGSLNKTMWVLEYDNNIYLINYLIDNEKSTKNMKAVINSIKIEN